MKNIFLEDIAYGIYDRPGPTGAVSDLDKEEGITVPESTPVLPSNQMSTQLSVERPPVEDEKYVPTNIDELSRSASAIARMVPEGQIEFFYRRLHELLDKATDQTVEKEEEKKNESVNRKIKRALREMLSDTDKEEFDKYRTGGIDYFGDSEELPVSRQKGSTEDTGEGKTLEQIAAAFGSKTGQIANETNRVLRRMEYFIQKIKDEDLEGLTQFATGEYVNTLLAGGFIDDEDAVDLRKLPSQYFRQELPSFGFFFVQSFVLPAYREIAREATQALDNQIKALDIPEILHQTVKNQITGAADRKPETIVRKLEGLVKHKDESKRITPRQAMEIARKIESARAKLSDNLQFSDDWAQRSLDKWNSSSKGARIKAVKQALEKTSDEIDREQGTTESGA